MSAGRVSRVRAWARATRPKTLPAAGAPVIVGTALALRGGAFGLVPALAAAVGALLLQITVNIANDYFDHVNGVDTPDRVGPVRVAAAGLIPLAQIRRGLALVVLLALADGVYLATRGGLPIIVGGIAAVLSAFAYSAGPVPLASRGLGDLFVFVFFGPVAVCGTYYVQARELSLPIVVASIPVGALVTAILVVNNYRDIETDLAAGKMTLATRVGRRGSRIEFAGLLAAVLLGTVTLSLLYRSGWPLVSLSTAVFAVPIIRDICGEAIDEDLNATLGATARLSFLFALGLAVGIVLAAD